MWPMTSEFKVWIKPQYSFSPLPLTVFFLSHEYGGIWLMADWAKGSGRGRGRGEWGAWGEEQKGEGRTRRMIPSVAVAMRRLRGTGEDGCCLMLRKQHSEPWLAYTRRRGLEQRPSQSLCVCDGNDCVVSSRPRFSDGGFSLTILE